MSFFVHKIRLSEEESIHKYRYLPALKDTNMLLKKFLLAILLFAYTFASAQKIRNQSTFRMLQTANTLVEAQQFEAAEEFFKKGIETARKTNDLYCEAYASQGL